MLYAICIRMAVWIHLFMVQCVYIGYFPFIFCMYRLIHFFIFFFRSYAPPYIMFDSLLKKCPSFFIVDIHSTVFFIFYMLYFFFLLLIYCNKFGFQFLYSYFFNTSGFMQFCCCCIAASILWYPTEYLFIGKRNKKAKLKNEDK